MLRAAAADDARRGEAFGRGGQRGDHAEAVRRLEHDLPPLAAAIGRDHDHRDVASSGWRRGTSPTTVAPLAATELSVALAAPAGGGAESMRQCRPSGEIHIDWTAPSEPTATSRRRSRRRRSRWSLQPAVQPVVVFCGPAAQVGGVPEDGEGQAGDHLPADDHVTGAAGGGPKELGARPRPAPRGR